MRGGVNLAHIRILTLTHARFALRGGSGIVFVVLALVSGLAIASFTLDPLDRLEQQFRADAGIADDDPSFSREHFVRMMVDGLRPTVMSFTGGNPDNPADVAFTRHLLDHRPALLSAVLVLLLLMIPFLTCAGAFNQVAGDASTRGLRYLLLRTERVNILLARWIGTAIFVCGALFLVGVITAIYITLKFDFYGPGETLAWGAHGFAAMIVLALPYISLCTLINTITDSPIACLVLAMLLSSLTAFGPSMIPGAQFVPWLDRLVPFGWKYDLLAADPGRIGLAVVVCCAWTVGLLLIALWRFERRDL